MGLFKSFFGKSPEEYEKKADAFVEKKVYGQAKIEYEKALNKLNKLNNKDFLKANYKKVIEKKLQKSKESLALVHKKNAEELIISRCYEEAEDLFVLAIELTEDDNLKIEIEKKLADLQESYSESEQTLDMQFDDVDNDYQDDDDEFFSALCHSLPEPEQTAYLSYGDTFKKGYLALNHGDFESAVKELTQALEDTQNKESYIPLELASAYLNLGDYSNAMTLLKEFLNYHPDSLNAYHLMCDILWEQKEFEEAEKLLLTCPKKLYDSMPIQMLKGETLFRSEKYEETASFYLKLLEVFGRDQSILRPLAITYEALGLNEKALALYGEIINTCKGCRTRIDPFVKQRYAEASLEKGDYSTNILRLFFELAKEDRKNQSHYFQQISNIYSKQGNEKEAKRYLSLL